jgi:hypothetical protein
MPLNPPVNFDTAMSVVKVMWTTGLVDTNTYRTLDETSCSAKVGNGCVTSVWCNIYYVSGINKKIRQGYCVFRLCATSGTVLFKWQHVNIPWD